MLANFHTHSVFCDGKNTPNEIVEAAIDAGMSAIGFSGHGYTDFDLRYCMKDTEGYIAEIKRLKTVYKDKIAIFLGVEEDAFCHVERSEFDYIIGSSHYYRVGDRYLPIDSSSEHFKVCLEEFGYDAVAMAHAYYAPFCDYILRRKPDIVGHFDLITKFDEMDTSLFLDNPEYHDVARQYILRAAESGCAFEVNTGAISRGYRHAPYPHESLLVALKSCGARLVLSSDSHSKDTLVFGFEETKRYLYDLGFRELYTLSHDGFIKYSIR